MRLKMGKRQAISAKRQAWFSPKEREKEAGYSSVFTSKLAKDACWNE